MVTDIGLHIVVRQMANVNVLRNELVGVLNVATTLRRAAIRSFALVTAVWVFRDK